VIATRTLLLLQLDQGSDTLEEVITSEFSLSRDEVGLSEQQVTPAATAVAAAQQQLQGSYSWRNQGRYLLLIASSSF
jgi:hypothetical protein